MRDLENELIKKSVSVKTFLKHILKTERRSGDALRRYQVKSGNIYILFTGREVRIEKTVPEASNTAGGRRPRAVLETEGTIFPNTDRPRPVNNILFISKSYF